MKRIIILLGFFLLGLAAKSQQDDTTKYAKYPNTYGIQYPRLWGQRVLRIPQDTTYSKSGIAQIGNKLYIGNGTKWISVSAVTNDTAYAKLNYSNTFTGINNFYGVTAFANNKLRLLGDAAGSATFNYDDNGSSNAETLTFPNVSGDSVAYRSWVNSQIAAIPSIDTTSLSDRINLKLNASDSSKYLKLDGSTTMTGNLLFDGISLIKIGGNSAVGNTGLNSVVGVGYKTNQGNSADYVNSLGEEAGTNNTYSNVNLFGQSASATATAQTVFSKDGSIMARLGYGGLSASRLYTLPDASGTIALVGGSGVGTVTSVATTNGIGISSSVANSTTTPNITIAVDTASASILSRQRAAATYVDSIRLVNTGVLHVTPATFSKSGSTGIVAQTLASQNAYTLFGRGSGTGTPSFLASIDSNWVTALRSENYYNTKYLKITDASSTYFPLLGGTLTGTAGSGFVGFPTQSSAPSTPSTGFRLYANSSNALSWKGANGFVRVFDGTANTADRTYTLPDASGTFPLLSTTNTWTSNQINSYTSTASTPASNLTGTWFTGGTATTTKPHLLIEPSGTTSNFWNTSGTGLGVNAANGFVGNLIDIYLNGAQRFRVTSTGNATISGTTSTSAITSLNSTSKLQIGTAGGTGSWMVFDKNVASGGTANVALGAFDANPAASAFFDIQSINKGFLMPRQTTAQRDAISSPATMLQVSDTTLKANVTYDGTRWTEGAKILKATATLDFPSTSSNSYADLTVSLTGAADGDVCNCGVPNGSVPNGVNYWCWVSATNTVTVRLINGTSGSVDPASGSFKIMVFKN